MASNKIDYRTAKNLLQLNWHPLEIEDKNLSFKIYIGEDNSLELLLFDLDQFKLFYTNQNEKNILEHFKELNPSLEAPILKILSHISENLLTNSQVNKKLFSIDTESKNVNDGLLVKMQSKLAGVKFSWEFDLECLDHKLIKDHLVLPLIFNCAEYQLREVELLKIIQAKDKEIDDYKSQGAKLSRKYLSTDEFKIESFDETIKKRNEIKEVIENPEKCLHTKLSHKISEDCFEKYLKTFLKKPESKVEPETPQKKLSPKKNKNEIDSTQSSNDQLSQKPISQSQKEARKEELEKKLQEEESKNSTKKLQNKKKKLF